MGEWEQPRIDAEGTEFSNGIRLTGREWLLVGAFTAILYLFIPSAWQRVERFEPEPDYRLPHDLGNDYGLYARHARLAAERSDTLVIGDSVVWGEYVTEDETLSHYLNARTNPGRYANLGLDGAHPLALAGLLEYYATAVRGKDVILQCNPLWLSSTRADLQDDRVTDFNHPRLVPQFTLRIPSYRAELSQRIGVVVERHVSMDQWTTHLQQAYYDRTDIPSWTLKHPYDNPLAPLRRGLPPPDSARRHERLRPWYKNGITVQDFAWVHPDTSLQWQAFRRAVVILRGRNNRVFVLVGPFNEHLLKPESLRRYQQVKAAITSWLAAEHIPYAAPPALKSSLYGDASHPLAPGYEELAGQLLAEPSFAAPP
jgi:hypothetical protein